MDSIGKQILVLYMPASRVIDGLFWSRKVDNSFPKIPSPTLALTSVELVFGKPLP